MGFGLNDWMKILGIQTAIKNLGRVVSRTDVPQEDFGKFTTIAEDITLAERASQLAEEYKRYLQ